jgi:hypothetical protein
MTRSATGSIVANPTLERVQEAYREDWRMISSCAACLFTMPVMLPS